MLKEKFNMMQHAERQIQQFNQYLPWSMCITRARPVVNETMLLRPPRVELQVRNCVNSVTCISGSGLQQL